jgi:hypothetical protein
MYQCISTLHRLVAFVTDGMVALHIVRGYGETKRLAIRPLEPGT